MNFTKTEIKLIKRLLNDCRNFSSIDTCHGRGSGGGSISHGCREVNALNNLIEKEILRRVAVDSCNRYENGYSIRITTIRYTWA